MSAACVELSRQDVVLELSVLCWCSDGCFCGYCVCLVGMVETEGRAEEVFMVCSNKTVHSHR